MRLKNLLTLKESKVTSQNNLLELHALVKDLDLHIDKVMAEQTKKEEQRKKILAFLKEMKYLQQLKTLGKVSIMRKNRKA